MSPPVPPKGPIRIKDKTPLTQYGSLHGTPHFHTEPRHWRGEKSLSVIVGHVDAVNAVINVKGFLASTTDTVRHTTAGRLRAVGLVVRHDPIGGHFAHCVVGLPRDVVPWDADLQVAFDEVWW